MTKTNAQTRRPEDVCTRGWKEALNAWTPSVRVTSAVFKLTNAGEKPAPLTEIAEAAGYSPQRTADLIQQIFSRTGRTTEGMVYFEMAARREPSSRF